MRNFLLNRFLVTGFAFAVIMLAGMSNANEVYAQSHPCHASGGVNPITRAAANRINQAINEFLAQGAVITCDDTNIYATMPNGTYFNMNVEGRMFIFDPVSGRTIYMYFLDGCLLIQDSVYGMINAGDGWYSVFYPVGNPFDASIQNPAQVLFMDLPSLDPWGEDGDGGGGGGGYQPIRS